jgi:hypothetical protein
MAKNSDFFSEWFDRNFSYKSKFILLLCFFFHIFELFLSKVALIDLNVYSYFFCLYLFYILGFGPYLVSRILKEEHNQVLKTALFALCSTFVYFLLLYAIFFHIYPPDQFNYVVFSLKNQVIESCLLVKRLLFL